MVVDFGIGEFQDDRVRRHRGAGFDDDALDVRGGFGGDPADLLRHQRARAAHLAQQFAALHGVDEDAALFDGGKGRAELGEADAGGGEQGDDDGADDELAAALALLEFGAGDVHALTTAQPVPSAEDLLSP